MRTFPTAAYSIVFYIQSLLQYTSPLYLSAVLQMEFGVVYSCLEDKMFTARRGKGAFCNGNPLQVSAQEGTTSIIYDNNHMS